jgi:hypothetical protein
MPEPKLDPTLSSGVATEVRVKQLEVALELTRLWIGETSWHSPGSVYDNAKVIGRVFEAYRRQVLDGQVVDPATFLADGAVAPEAWGNLDIGINQTGVAE